MRKPKKFVVQQHQQESEQTHWDLMLEAGEFLETYRLPASPEKWGKEPIEATKIFNHPLKFLTYHGPVNKGKGQVTIADSGEYRLIAKNENQQEIAFDGKLLSGKYQLCRLKQDIWELTGL